MVGTWLLLGIMLFAPVEPERFGLVKTALNGM